MHGVFQGPTENNEQSTDSEQSTLLEKRVTELADEIENLNVKLKDNEQQAKHLQTLLDFMANILLDELQISPTIPYIFSTKPQSDGPSSVPSDTKTHSTSKQSENDPGVGTSVAEDANNRTEERIQLLEQFCEIIQTSPWESYGHSNGFNNSERTAAASQQAGSSSGSLPLLVFRNGRWVNQ